MAPTALTSYNGLELARILSTLKETKLTLTVKLNLLRVPASTSPIHLVTFNGLENRFIDIGSQIWRLEAEKQRMNIGIVSLKENADEGEEVRDSLKKALALVGALDTLGEEVMRLKITLEGTSNWGGQNMGNTATAAGSQGGVVGGSQDAAKAGMVTVIRGLAATAASPQERQEAARRTSLAVAQEAAAARLAAQRRISKIASPYVREVDRFGDGVPAASRCTNIAPAAPAFRPIVPADFSITDQAPASKKQKLEPFPQAQAQAAPSQSVEVKQEQDVPKPAKVANWAPDGYYYVKAHFRRKPKRKAKEAAVVAEKAVKEPPASVEIVDLDGV